MASLAQTGPLELKKKVGNLCIFLGQRAGHYRPMLDVQIVPYLASVWSTAKKDAIASAVKSGSEFGRVNSKLFFVSGTTTAAGLPTCTKGDGSPGKGGSEFGPVCAGEPSAPHFGAYGNGEDKRVHLHLMVSAALRGQEGDIHLSHVLALVKDVISGKIH